MLHHPSNSSPRFLRNLHFWLIVVFFTIGVIFHYAEQLAFWNWPAQTSLLGLDRHTVERVYFLAPIIYAGFVFRLRGGILGLVAGLVIMLPRAIFLSVSQTTAVLEVVFVVSIGIIVNLLFDVHRRRLEHAEETDALLKLEEEKWRSSFNALEDIMIIVDRDYNIENINTAGLMAIGMSREEVVGRKCYEMMSGRDSPLDDCPCPLILKTKRVGSVDRYEEQFGKYFSIKSSPILDEAGEVVKFVELRHDITERKKAEEMLSNIVDGSSIPLFVINRFHEVTHWNRAIETLTGISREEMVGTNGQWRSFYKDKRPVLADLIVDGAAEEEINRLYDGRYSRSNLIEGAYEADSFFPALGTEGRWLHFTASPIKDERGNLTGATETLQDITELVNTEEALRQSESRFRDLFENALDAIWVHDLEGNILMANRAATKLTGYSTDEMYRSNLRTFLTGGSLSLAREIKQKLMQRQSVDLTYEQTLTKKDGTKITCVIATNLVSLNGEPVAFQNIARDVTDERQMHENLRYYLREITRAQEEERKRIARELHDSTAQTLIALLHQLENFLSDKTKLPVGEAKTLWNFHERLRDILQEVRRFSHDLRPSVLDDLGLLPALELVTGELKNLYGVKVDLKVSGEERRLPQEAELLVFRIVQEALRNVAKHARATNAKVTVRFDENKIVVTVKDDGIGFSLPQDLGYLPHKGKLGLAGIQERVQLLGGSLKLESELGKGTTVIVEAPL